METQIHTGSLVVHVVLTVVLYGDDFSDFRVEVYPTQMCILIG